MDIQKIIPYLRGASSKGYEIFGAHFVWEQGKSRVRFAVYAPNAQNVAVTGSFNSWTDWNMERLDCGVWTLLTPIPQEGDLYKYRITTAQGEVWDRADPFAFQSELRPSTASILCRLTDFPWQDGDWLSKRNKNFERPLSIYEVHAGSWRIKNGEKNEQRFFRYDELAKELIPYVKRMGYSHIELLPLTEYPLDASWGYQVSGYFSSTSRYGTPKQLMELINQCHRENIGVILDFVPAHFVRDFYALHLFDGSCLYEHDDPNHRYSPWDTALFDFTKPHVNSFLRSSLDFWISVYHFDGIRYDAVANLIYHNGKKEDGLNEEGIWFLKSTNYALQQDHPQVMLIAEDSSDHLKVTAPAVYGGLGFDYKWDLGWMHDTLNFFATPFGERHTMPNFLLFSMSYFYNENYILAFSHDEVVHGKKTIIDKLWGTYEEKFAQLKCLSLYMTFHPGKKLSFMGNELAEFREWDEEKEPGWNLLDYPAHLDFFHFLQKLNHIYLKYPALWEKDHDSRYFRWLYMGPDVFSIERKNAEGQTLLMVINLSDHDCPFIDLQCDGRARLISLLDTQGQEHPDLLSVPFGDSWKFTLPVKALTGTVFLKEDCR